MVWRTKRFTAGKEIHVCSCWHDTLSTDMVRASNVYTGQYNKLLNLHTQPQVHISRGDDTFPNPEGREGILVEGEGFAGHLQNCW